MKIATNFVPPVQVLATRTAYVAWALALVFLSIAGIFWFDAQVKSEDISELRSRLAQIDARRKAMDVPPEIPSTEELAQLRTRVASVNSLSVTNGRRLVPLLVLFEELLPPPAWLVSLSYKAREGEVVLVAEAPRAEQLTAFLLQLEKSARFSETLLVRQTPLGRDERRTVQFEVRLKERL